MFDFRSVNLQCVFNIVDFRSLIVLHILKFVNFRGVILRLFLIPPAGAKDYDFVECIQEHFAQHLWNIVHCRRNWSGITMPRLPSARSYWTLDQIMILGEYPKHDALTVLDDLGSIAQYSNCTTCFLICLTSEV